MGLFLGGLMPLCTLCAELRGAPGTTDPHPRLQYTTYEPHGAMGFGKGGVYRYECLDCGTHMSQDRDSQDPFATWGVE